MMQSAQARNFYRSLSEKEKTELCKAIAEDIFFLEDSLQEKILEALHEAEPELAEEIKKINSFTIY